MILSYLKIDCILGQLRLVSHESALIAVLWEKEPPNRVKLVGYTQEMNPSHPILQLAAHQLQEYFERKRTVFDLPLDPTGSNFQQSVWSALQKIPYGHTHSYASISQSIKRPHAVRAVGTAIGKNPLSIIIPCHRVIGSDGSLGGFAGGLKSKKILLQLERISYVDS